MCEFHRSASKFVYNKGVAVSELSNSAQDYLKTIWQATEWSDEPVTVKQLAERLGFRPSTISEGVKKLVDNGLIEHRPYGDIVLTPEGEQLAIMMIRRHRLIETFLVNTLEYTWDEVHDEAEVLEHAVSDMMIERIDAFLGHPVRDPHGDPIPNAQGELPIQNAIALADLGQGKSAVISRISDESSEMLRFCAERNVHVDQQIRLLKVHPYADSYVVELEGSPEEITLSGTVANSIWVDVA